MRDPLHWMSVKRKLALAFAGLCLLAFGVGGFLISRSAREVLREEINARIELQCVATARALDDHLRLLRRRTEDFASDGYLRERTESLLEATEATERERLREELRAHLQANKLPLVEAFVGLTLVDDDGQPLVHVDDGSEAVLPIDQAPLRGADGRVSQHSDLLSSSGSASVPLQAISTPLLRLDASKAVGHLIAWIDPSLWIASSVTDLGPPGPGAREQHARVALRVWDRRGRSVAVPLRPRAATSRVRLRIEEPGATRAPRPGKLLFQHEVAIRENGWKVHVQMSGVDAFAPISGLQSRFLGVGAILAALCGALLFFPMRFLVRPLGELREAARRIRAGDYSVRMSVNSSDEVGELARSFNHMAEAVDQQTQRLRRAAEELRARQRELRQQHERLDTVIRSLRDGLVVLDADGRPVLANDAAAPLVKLLTAGDERLTSHYECRADSSASCAACLVEPAGPTLRCVLDVGERVFEVHGAPLPPDGDGRRGRVLVARDISERVAQDERDIHRERLSVLGEVAAVMAHELNNPLTSIRMFAQMLTDALPEGSPFREHASVIVRNTETCRHTIGELLGYATASAPEAGPILVHDVLEEVRRFVRPIAERAHAELVMHLDAAEHTVTGDEIQLRQLFVNLVMNAVQAAAGERVTVTIATQSDAGVLVADVTDTGPGIPEGLRDRVFDAFVSTKQRGEGTGLGLPTARRIAELHGGSVELVASRPGETTFRVRLRAAVAVAAGSDVQ